MDWDALEYQLWPRFFRAVSIQPSAWLLLPIIVSVPVISIVPIIAAISAVISPAVVVIVSSVAVVSPVVLLPHMCKAGATTRAYTENRMCVTGVSEYYPHCD
jgi:hypothetical protein